MIANNRLAGLSDDELVKRLERAHKLRDEGRKRTASANGKLKPKAPKPSVPNEGEGNGVGGEASDNPLEPAQSEPAYLVNSPFGEGGGEPPPEAVQAAPQAEESASDRDANGRFRKGVYRGGPGNPYARKVAALRSALINAVSDEDISEIVKQLVNGARLGSLKHIKLLFEYTVGRPQPADPDAISLHEWRLLDASPTRFEFFRALVDSVPPAHAAEFLRAFLPATADESKAAGRFMVGDQEVGEVIEERKHKRRKRP